MKKFVFAVLILALAAFAQERIPMECDDLLRSADSVGVRILPKTFDSIVEGDGWVCHEGDNGSRVAVSQHSHHILVVAGDTSTDYFVERLSGGEREVSVAMEPNKPRKVEILGFGSIERLYSAMN